ncbi:hypothetical protein [Streptomyces spiramenti]|uniref:Phosphatidylethanolamine-binding protein n=1 Tax=Streptomyces spiramenti TaxID=2720606 RepID=A0ABX1AI67_9ACTN|nr:hypothetical protein [Streptomyces spiramenti]NJP64785.1 hypothetical protein [Streptomyces spiramenti]
MGFFRKNTDNGPSNPEMAELGREFAIAKRHGDRRKVREINRTLADNGMTDTDRDSFDHGRAGYDNLPAVPGSKRRNRRR